MKKILFLSLFPSISFAFQTEIHGTFNAAEYDALSTSSGYHFSINTYDDDIYFDGKPFKEAGFLMEESFTSVSLGVTDVDSNGEVSAVNNIGISRTRFRDDFLFSYGIAMSKEEGAADNAEVRNYYLSSGLKLDKRTMIHVQIDYIDFLDTAVTSTNYTAGIKAVFRKANLELTYTDINVTDNFNSISASATGVVYEYYYSNRSYIGSSHVSITGNETDLLNSTSSSLMFGALISRKMSFQARYTLERPLNANEIKLLVFDLGYTF